MKVQDWQCTGRKIAMCLWHMAIYVLTTNEMTYCFNKPIKHILSLLFVEKYMLKIYLSLLVLNVVLCAFTLL